MFVLRFPTAHNKGNVFAVRLLLVHSKDNEQSNGVTSGWKKMFVVRYEKNARQTICLSWANIKTHDKLFFYRAFFLPCTMENTHGKDQNAQQTSISP
jgi:hypothetical protein